MRDLRFALRQLGKQPLLTAVIVLSLGIGIGVNTIVLTWMRGLVVRPIAGLREAQSVVVVCPEHKTAGIGHTLSLLDIRSLAGEKRIFSGITGSQMGTALMRVGEQNDWLWVEVPLANYFEVLGVAPVLGRGFEPGEDNPSPAVNAVVISYHLWQRRFRGDRSVIGRPVQINKQPATIVGVAPESFRGTMGGLGFDAWIVPALFDEHDVLVRQDESRGWRWAHTLARLAPGMDVERARTALELVTDRLRATYPGSYVDVKLVVLPLWRSPWGGQALFLPLLQALGIASVLLLLLVTANVAHLLLARAHQRSGEMAVRLAMGARRRRIVQQLFTESLVLAGWGGAAGCLIAMLGPKVFFALLPPTYLPITIEIGFDGWVLAATTCATVAAGVAFGFAPAMHSARADLRSVISEGGRSHSRRSRQYLRAAFVIGEVALATVLLVGMGLCLRSLAKSHEVNVGLDPDDVFVAGFRIGPNDGDDARVNAFYQRLREETARLPHVEAVGLADWLPLGFEGGSSTRLDIDGYSPAPGESMDVEVSIVSPGYFDALRIPVREGRGFEERDSGSDPLLVVINETFAARYFAGRNPVGLNVNLWGREAMVLGVAARGKYHQLNEPPLPWIYVNQLQHTDRTLTLVVRSPAPAGALRQRIEQLAARLDPTVSPVASLSYRDYIGAAWAVPRMVASLLSGLGVFAWVLAVVGVYAVVNQQAVQRTREVAIRMALGAEPAQILRTILRSGMLLALVGLALGGLAAVGLARVLNSLLIGIGPGDAVAWLGTMVVLLAAVFIACWLPARRAARLDPMVALRFE
jgi:predicted permease